MFGSNHMVLKRQTVDRAGLWLRRGGELHMGGNQARVHHRMQCRRCTAAMRLEEMVGMYHLVHRKPKMICILVT